MGSIFSNEKQKKLFDEIEKSGDLIFACGPEGVSANIVGKFKVKYISAKDEHRLDMEDGTNHVHIDWTKVTRFECGEFHEQGKLTFYNENSELFRLYRCEGLFFKSINDLEGDLSQ